MAAPSVRPVRGRRTGRVARHARHLISVLHKLDALVAEFEAAGFDLPWYGVVVRIPELLPDAVLAEYGLDAH